MKSTIHILHLEDDSYDGALVEGALKSGGIPFTITRVETHDPFVAELSKGGIDLILSDYTLPGFNGLSALKISLTERPEVPFIFVSGTLGEDQAIAALKTGATDYVLKKNLSRLAPVVSSAMEEVEGRARQRLFETREVLRKGLIIPPQRTTRLLPYVPSGYRLK